MSAPKADLKRTMTAAIGETASPEGVPLLEGVALR